MAVIAARRAPSSQVPHFADRLRSEFCKLRTVRSTYWSLAAAVVFNVALAAILAAVPQRRLMLAAKTTVFAVTALIIGTASCFAAYLAFQAFLSAGDAMRTSLSDPGVLRAVAGAGLYLTVLGLCGLGIGAVIRSSAGAVATLFGVLFVPSLIVTLLPQSWQDTVGRHLPMVAGEAIITVRHQAHTLQPWPGFGVFCLYAAAALTAAIVLISRRDA